jgi:hypothetical protein
MTGHDALPVSVRSLEAADMAALPRLVRRCYGETYAETGFYDAGWLEARLHTGQLISIGAFVDRRLIAHMGATVDRPGDVVADTIAAMVAPGHRGHGLVQQMGRCLFRSFQRNGILATRHLATGTHLRTQQPLAASGAVPTGVLLGHVPARTDIRDVIHGFGDRRIGVVAYFQRYGILEDFDVYFPTRYASVLTRIYDHAGLTRFEAVAYGPPIDELTVAQIDVHHNARADVTTISIASTATERLLSLKLAAELDACRAEVVYVDVPLARPNCTRTVEWLCQQGFVFGALLPGTADSERLRMQRVPAHRVAPDLIECATSEGQELRNLIAAESRSAMPQKPAR